MLILKTSFIGEFAVQGYTLFSRKHKLKSEYVGRGNEEIRDLRLSGQVQPVHSRCVQCCITPGLLQACLGHASSCMGRAAGFLSRSWPCMPHKEGQRDWRWMWPTAWLAGCPACPIAVTAAARPNSNHQASQECISTRCCRTVACSFSVLWTYFPMPLCA